MLELWAAARSSHAVTPDEPSAVEGLLQDGSLLVAVRKGAVLGALIAAWDGWRGNMYRLAVVPEERRSGIGRTLVEAGEAALRARGAKRVTALVAKDDEVACGLWLAAGYENDERIGRFVRNL